MCAGSEPQANARAEREVGALKTQMRTLLLASSAPIHHWPLAFRQSVEMRQRAQLRRLGGALPQLLPFGSTAVVRRKEWHHRADPFRWPMVNLEMPNGPSSCENNNPKSDIQLWSAPASTFFMVSFQSARTRVFPRIVLAIRVLTSSIGVRARNFFWICFGGSVGQGAV